VSAFYGDTLASYWDASHYYGSIPLLRVYLPVIFR
jgi:hypothetical protein